jgi:hypothetical protein
MSGSRQALLGGVLLVAVASTASAQEWVPGGWAPQVGFQTFAGAGFSGGFGAFSNANGLMPYAPGTAFGSLPGSRGGPTPFWMQGQPQTANVLLPLGDTIRRSTRRRSLR